MKTIAGGQVQAEPNVVPLIDIMMVLMIIFMVVAAAQYEALFAQIVPDAREGEQTDVQSQIVLEVGAGARYAINRQVVPAESLGVRLRQVYAGRPNRTLLVRGDGRALYQEIVTAIDIARGAGVRVVGLWTHPR